MSSGRAASTFKVRDKRAFVHVVSELLYRYWNCPLLPRERTSISERGRPEVETAGVQNTFSKSLMIITILFSPIFTWKTVKAKLPVKNAIKFHYSHIFKQNQDLLPCATFDSNSARCPASGARVWEGTNHSTSLAFSLTLGDVAANT